MSHCAMVTGKWQQILYGEINQCVCETFENALSGKYDYDRFCPEFIDREQFKQRRATDGYIRLCWSFGCNGIDYLYSVEKEPMAKAIHNAVVFNDFTLSDNLHIKLHYLNKYKNITKAIHVGQI